QLLTTDMLTCVQKYYGSRLESSCDLQTSASSCSVSCRPLPSSVREALSLVHPEVTKKFFGCGLPFPAKFEGCRVLDLGSGSGRDCYAFSKLVGPTGYVTGIDMTEELISVSRQYIDYHQKKFGYEKPNVTFVQGYMEKLGEAGIQSDSVDVAVSNCVICLCPDKRAVLQQAYNVLKEGGELYFSDMYASKVIPDHMKQDPVLWGEGMSGSLFWQDLISLAHSVGFSTPYLVSATNIVVHDSELKAKAGRYQKDVAVEVNREMAAVLHSSRFCSDFKIQISDKAESCSESTPQYCHLNPFLLADKMGSSVKQCSKTSK
ncbi:hypothetical protein L3Q82_018845, partial [Scortum barcoo]